MNNKQNNDIQIYVGVHPVRTGLAGRLAVGWVQFGDLIRINSLELWETKQGGYQLKWPTAQTSRAIAYPPSPRVLDKIIALFIAEYYQQNGHALTEKGGAVHE